MIRRSPRPQTGWTTFSNDVLADEELSFRALGVLVYVLSKPDHWTARSEQLADSHAEGRDAVRTALEHLELAGYVKRDRRQDDAGRWHTDSIFYDRPFDRYLGDITEDGFPGVGDPGIGNPGFSTRTEEQGLSSKGTTRGAARRRGRTPPPTPKPAKKSKMPPREPDDPTTSTDEAPARGGSPRPTRPERDAEAARRGVSGVGLAKRLQDGLKEEGTKGSDATVDRAALGKRLAGMVREGTHTYELLASCVDVYLAAPDRYRSGDRKGWTQFLAALPKLEADADKIAQASYDHGAVSAYAEPAPYTGPEDVSAYADAWNI